MMAKNRIAAGRKVQFDPFEPIIGYGVDVCRGLVTGTVAWINTKHKWFLVTYGDGNQRICFKFCDIGKAVKFVG